jgi:hypothetical protein
MKRNIGCGLAGLLIAASLGLAGDGDEGENKRTYRSLC